MLLTNRHNFFTDTSLFVQNTMIERVHEFKYLGMTLISNQTSHGPHILILSHVVLDASWASSTGVFIILGQILF